jgi:hypothetical protein
MNDPKPQSQPPQSQPPADPEWEQERPYWEAYQRGEFRDEDFITLEELLEEYPELRELMNQEEQTETDE